MTPRLESRESEPKMSQREFLRDERYLPAPLRDFHDAKDAFKSLHEWIGKAENPLTTTPDWVTGQCYTIDYFLKFMAAHGWTMQRSRARVEFASLSATIKARRDRETELMRGMFAKSKSVSLPSCAATPEEGEQGRT